MTEVSEKLQQGAIVRLARQAGVYSIDAGTNLSVREIIMDELSEILISASTITQHLRKVIITANTIVCALPVHMYSKNIGHKNFKTLNRPKKNGDHRWRRGTVVFREIKHFQKQYGTLLIAKETFQRAVRACLSKLGFSLRFSATSLLLLQSYIENYVVKLMSEANKCAIHAGRTTLHTQDLQLVRAILASKITKPNESGAATLNFSSYIFKVLKQVHPNSSISLDAKSQINEILYLMANIISKKANFLISEECGHNPDHAGTIKGLKNGKNKNISGEEQIVKLQKVEQGKRSKPNATKKETVSSREIQTAVRLLIPEELGKHAMSEGTKAVTKYTSSADSVVLTSTVLPKRHSQSSSAGLIFPVSKAKAIIRQCGADRISKTAAVYLAAVMEYMAAEILNLAGNSARDNRKVIISARHVFLALQGDEELSRIMNRMGFVVVGGGVVPHIHSALLKSKDSRKRSSKNKKGTDPEEEEDEEEEEEDADSEEEKADDEEEDEEEDNDSDHDT